MVAIEKLPTVAASAGAVARDLGLPIMFACCDLFRGIGGRFDMIVFNAPYVDIDRGRQLKILESDQAASRFSGGRGGAETIARFLAEAPAHLNQNGIAVLGENHYHVARPIVLGQIEKSGLKVHQVLQTKWRPSTGYVLCLPNAVVAEVVRR